jgi:hypothetical protein
MMNAVVEEPFKVRDEIPVAFGGKILSLSGRQVFVFPFRRGTIE